MATPIYALERYQQYRAADQANEMRGLQMQGALAKMQQEQADRADMEKLKGVLAQSGGDPSKAIQALMSSGHPKALELASKLQGSFGKAQGQSIGAGGLRMPDGTIVAPAARPASAPAPTRLDNYIKMRDSLPEGDPRRKIYDNAIRKESETAKQISPTIVMPRQEQPVQTYTDGAGKLWERERGGQWKPAALGEGSPGMALRPSPGVLKDQQAKAKLKSDLDSVIPNLEAISKDGGLLDQSTGSGAGALVDVAAGFVGKATPGSIAVGKLKPLVDPILKLVPRFEGPQSDKDVQTYRDAAGDLSNPAVPNARKKAAAKTILEIYRRRRSQFTTSDYDASAVAPNAATTPLVVDFNSLPK